MSEQDQFYAIEECRHKKAIKTTAFIQSFLFYVPLELGEGGGAG